MCIFDLTMNTQVETKWVMHLALHGKIRPEARVNHQDDKRSLDKPSRVFFSFKTRNSAFEKWQIHKKQHTNLSV